MTNTTATVLLPSATYRDRGLTLPGQSHDGFAEQFRALGGERCLITRPSGAPVGTSPRHMHVHFAGSDDALAFVLACASS